MKEWMERHLLLTGAERRLVIGILLIALCGLGVKYCRRTGAEADVSARPGSGHAGPHQVPR